MAIPFPRLHRRDSWITTICTTQAAWMATSPQPSDSLHCPERDQPPSTITHRVTIITSEWISIKKRTQPNDLPHSSLPVTPSPKRGAAAGTTPEEWSNSLPRPKSSIIRSSTSGTVSDRSPGGYSTPRHLAPSLPVYENVSPQPMESITTVSTGSNFLGGYEEVERTVSSALRRSREPSPVTVVTDFITTGPYR